MQQFTVPQFIDVEDKIIGPVTTRQFVIILAGFLLIGISYKLFDFSLFVAITGLIFSFTIVFAFIKVNGRPFHFFVLNLIQTLKRAHLRVWNISTQKAEADYDWEGKKEEIKEATTLSTKRYTTSRLTELSLIVDTKGEYRGEEKGVKAKIELSSNKIELSSK